MRLIGEVVGALALFVVAVLCWNLGITESTFAAVPDGSPEFVATRYSGSWITVSTVAVSIALLLLVDAFRTAIRRRSHTG